ncbi:hypothetical protein [Erwinia tasmaniensis]|uniref:hypothetical protein n=1 Tax=Erwinia tasmaniensis TaxID=338565 RepID=UPI003A4D212E
MTNTFMHYALQVFHHIFVPAHLTGLLPVIAFVIPVIFALTGCHDSPHTQTTPSCPVCYVD